MGGAGVAGDGCRGLLPDGQPVRAGSTYAVFRAAVPGDDIGTALSSA